MLTPLRLIKASETPIPDHAAIEAARWREIDWNWDNDNLKPNELVDVFDALTARASSHTEAKEPDDVTAERKPLSLLDDTPARAVIDAAIERATQPGGGIQLVSADTVTTQAAEWVWEYDGKGRILKAAVTLFGGRPGAGKSTAARWFVAQLTNGTLDGCWHGEPINVAYIATEESWHHTVKPSLQAAGADMKRIFYIKKPDGTERVNAIEDEDALAELFVASDIRAVFLDPLMGTITGGADINRNNEVRDYLDPWVRIAEKINGPVIGICHMTKAPTGDVVASITGSSAFGEVARCVFGFAIDRDDEEGTRVMSQAKNSAGFEDLSLAYRLDGRRVDTDDGKSSEQPTFVLLGPTERTVRELLIADRSAGQRSGTDDCAKWLKGYLAMHGRVMREDIVAAAAEWGYSAKMTQRAGAKIGVQTERTREVPPRTFWELPAKHNTAAGATP